MSSSSARMMMLVLAQLSLLMLLSGVDAVGFRSVCTHSSTLYTIMKNPETGQYYQVDTGKTRRNLLRETEYEYEDDEDDWSDANGLEWQPGIVVQDDLEHFFQNSKNKNEQRRLESEVVRKCSCGPFRNEAGMWVLQQTVYCPLTTDRCGTYRRPDNYEAYVGCLTLAKNKDMNNFVILICFVWFSVLIFWLISTRRICNVWGFCLDKCYPRYNEHVANAILREQPQLARELIRRNIAARRHFMHRQMQDGMSTELALDMQAAIAGERQANADREAQQQQILLQQARAQQAASDNATPTSLALKTRIYRKKKDEQPTSPQQQNLQKAADGGSEEQLLDAEDYDSNCTICFQPLQDGDRVGALPCSHVFHVDCLKTWLQRRNTCPLCNADQVAQPQYAQNNDNTATASANDNHDNDNEATTAAAAATTTTTTTATAATATVGTAAAATTPPPPTTTTTSTTTTTTSTSPIATATPASSRESPDAGGETPPTAAEPPAAVVPQS